MSKKAYLPFLIFVVLVGFLVVGLKLNPRLVPSPFVGKPAPEFNLPTLYQADQKITNQSMQGKVWLFNVWASWCAACRDEHPLLVNLAAQNEIDLVGLNYKDERTDAINWLAQFGNPYGKVAFDNAGQTAIDYGVYGVPETFVIDKRGIVRLKHIGPLSRKDVDQTLLPLISQLQQEKT